MLIICELFLASFMSLVNLDNFFYQPFLNVNLLRCYNTPAFCV